MKRQATKLETVFVTVPADAVPAFEAALSDACSAVGLFIADEAAGTWRVEGVKPQGNNDQLSAGLAMAELATGISPVYAQAGYGTRWLARPRL